MFQVFGLRVSCVEYNVFLAGVGGMGILTASTIISKAAMREGHNVVMSEVHGLSQRYGMVYTTVRIGDVHAPLIKEGDAHVVLGLEPVEALRYAYMARKEDGYIIVNLNPVPPPTVSAGLSDYPDLNKVLATIKKFAKNVITINALEIAKEIGSPLLQNTILLGIMFSLPTFPLKPESGKEAIKEVFSGKEKIIEMNLKAFEKGLSLR